MGVICDNCKRKNNNTHTTQQPQNKIIKYENFCNALKENTCYTIKAEIIKKPDIEEDYFRIKITAIHNGDHSCDEQTLKLFFNYPVNFISCSNGSINSFNNTTRLNIKLKYHNNQNDKIEIDDFIVKCAYNDLEIVECYISDNN